jgi:ABC-type branched-subunit amino acid transport system ATPase component
MNEPLLSLREISMHFGGLKALDKVSFDLREGEILGLIGPNGAGKTTCFNTVSGVYRPTSGEIRFQGNRTDGLPPHRMAALGIGRTFQIVRPFPNLTVLENVLVAAGLRCYGKLIPSCRTWKGRQTREEAMGILSRVGLENQAEQKAGLLPLGNLRRLELARALALKPHLLLLDESFSGLRHEEIAQQEELIRKTRESGISILLIEHNMRVAMGLCDRLVVLDHGVKLAEGTPETIRNNPEVIRAYLGKGSSANAS